MIRDVWGVGVERRENIQCVDLGKEGCVNARVRTHGVGERESTVAERKRKGRH